MKAMHKQLWGYLLITLSLAGFTPLQAQTDSVDEGGYITVSGIVKRQKEQKRAWNMLIFLFQAVRPARSRTPTVSFLSR